MAEGSVVLTERDFRVLQTLAAFPEEEFVNKVRVRDRFTKEYDPSAGFPSVQERVRLLNRFGQYGIACAVEDVRQGRDLEEVRQHLMELSGVERLRHIIISHFGNRAFLVKTYNMLNRLNAVCYTTIQNTTDAAIEPLRRIAGEVESLLATEHSFVEFKVLRDYYADSLRFTEDEATQMLQVTGEYGTSCAERLGMPRNTSPEDLVGIARERVNYWHLRTNDPTLVSSTRNAVRVLSRSFENVEYRIAQAIKYLY
jgi:hypothetical protein